MNNTRKQNDTQQILAIAYRKLNTRYRVLASSHEAVVIWRDFDPCKAVQAIATVHWPATVAMRNVIITHTIMEGDCA